ncbi:hypothetical protein CK203_074435 [Vitis vinifera]|uniref:Uncharacterized protein n=1 Tax=Vitis vinifera TaxID=29760 RepID=A0A438EGS4_VITVI|nr:hypothetical protein CK203_074435 [Vitis vinifera]
MMAFGWAYINNGITHGTSCTFMDLPLHRGNIGCMGLPIPISSTNKAEESLRRGMN